MPFTKHLRAAGVPEHLHPAALRNLLLARQRTRGLTWAKWKVRLFKAGEISRLLDWQDERLCERSPQLAAWDIAPMLNITAHGDNTPWQETPEGGRPAPGQWLNADPASAEYQSAVAANYWCRGEHPRSKKSRKAWYRRNAGEYEAWSRGDPLPAGAALRTWQGPGVRVYCAGTSWLVEAERRLLGPLVLRTRAGFEVDNVFCAPGNAQAWYPIDGHDLRAPATWSVLPGKSEM